MREHYNFSKMKGEKPYTKHLTTRYDATRQRPVEYFKVMSENWDTIPDPNQSLPQIAHQTSGS